MIHFFVCGYFVFLAKFEQGSFQVCCIYNGKKVFISPFFIVVFIDFFFLFRLPTDSNGLKGV